MTLTGLAAKSLLRNKVRSFLTISGVAVAILAFLLIQTVVAAWEMGAELAAKDRVVTRHKVTFVMTVPRRYVDVIRETPGVKHATWANWFGGKNPAAEREFFSTLACDPESFFTVYDEYGIAPAALEAFKADRQGAIIGDVLAKKFGWKVGDTVKIESAIYPGDWTFHVVGIYEPLRKSAVRDQFLFQWDYFNEQAPFDKESVGWIVSRVEPGVGAAELAKRLDQRFDEYDTQTLSQDEGTFAQSFLGMFSAILAALNVVSIVILSIMMLILGNTVAMGARERIREYAVLRAVGFLPKHVLQLVLGEAATLGILGGLAGIAIAVPLIGGMGAWIEVNMAAFFPIFRLGVGISVLAVAIATVLGTLAGVIPGIQSARLKVVDALRYVA